MEFTVTIIVSAGLSQERSLEVHRAQGWLRDRIDWNMLEHPIALSASEILTGWSFVPKIVRVREW